MRSFENQVNAKLSLLCAGLDLLFGNDRLHSAPSLPEKDGTQDSPDSESFPIILTRLRSSVENLERVLCDGSEIPPQEPQSPISKQYRTLIAPS